MNNQPTPFDALMECRDLAGSDSQMARDLRISQPRMWRIINRIGFLPSELVLTAERLYGVSRHDLRPDIYPRNYPPAPDRGRRRVDFHRQNAGAR